MTHHDDARLDLLAHLGDGDTKDLQRGMQELIDAELTATIGAVSSTKEPTPARISPPVADPGRCRRRPVTSSRGSRSCVSGRSSRRCWSRAAGSTKRCGR